MESRVSGKVPNVRTPRAKPTVKKVGRLGVRLFPNLGRLVVLQNPSNNNSSFLSSILHNLARRRLDRLLDNVDSQLLVKVQGFDLSEHLAGLEQSGTTAGQDTVLDSSAGRVQGVHEAVLLLTDLDFRGTADLDHGNPTGKLGKTFLELLLFVFRGGVGDEAADLFAAGRDGVFAAAAVEEDGVVLGDGCGSGGSELFGGALWVWRKEDVSMGHHQAGSSDLYPLKPTLSSFMSNSSVNTVPPVMIAMSCNVALRLSPNPGALTQHT